VQEVVLNLTALSGNTRRLGIGLPPLALQKRRNPLTDQAADLGAQLRIAFGSAPVTRSAMFERAELSVSVTIFVENCLAAQNSTARPVFYRDPPQLLTASVGYGSLAILQCKS
jgi:hypothetical protein